MPSRPNDDRCSSSDRSPSSGTASHYSTSDQELDELKEESSAGSERGESREDTARKDEETSRSSSESDNVEYVKGHPVIRTGADVSRFLVSDHDDGAPAMTFRSLSIGTVFSVICCAISMLYKFKPHVVAPSTIFMLVSIHLTGEAWARLTPSPARFSRFPRFQTVLRAINFSQTWSIKESVVSTLIAACAREGLAGIDVYTVQRLFYDQPLTPLTGILATFSMATCGIAFASFLMPLAVYPQESVFWGELPQIILWQSLHNDKQKNRRRLKKFGIALVIMAVWQFFPSYIFQTLGGVSVFCIASAGASTDIRAIFANLFGGYSANEGMGILSISFDWQYITSSSLSIPLDAQFNVWIGTLIAWAVMPALYYGNAWGAKGAGLPMMSNSLYVTNGTVYPVKLILAKDGTIDQEKYQQVGQPLLTSSTVLGFITQNMAIGALLSHLVIFHGKSIVKSVKTIKKGESKDPHYQAIRKYKEIPRLWHFTLFGLSFIAGLIAILKGVTTLSWWAYLCALIAGAIIAPFSTVINGIYGIGVDTTEISKMLGGLLQPGRPLAVLYFSCWSHQVILLSAAFSSWLKIGQYIKVPPRVLFIALIYAVLLGSGLNYLFMILIVDSQRAILLDPKGNNIWSGASYQRLNSAAVTWSLSHDLYSVGGRYLIVPVALGLGIFVPVVHWLLARFIPKIKSWPITTPLLIATVGKYYLGATAQITSQILLGIFSQVYLRKRRPGIFNKYNFLIGAAMDGGSQLVMLLLSFTVYGVTGNPHPFPNWWGSPQQGNVDHCIEQ